MTARATLGLLMVAVGVVACGSTESSASGQGGSAGAGASGGSSGGGGAGTGGSAGTGGGAAGSGAVECATSGVVSGSGDDSPLAVDATGDGGFVVAGAFAGDLELLGKTYSAPTQGGYVLRLSAAGEPVWAHVFGEEADTAPRSLAVAPNGDIWVAGGHVGSVDFGFGAAPAEDDFFLLRLDGEGTPLSVWTFDTNDASPSSTAAVAVAPDGEVYFSSRYNQALDVGGFALAVQDPTCSRAFVAKLSTSFALQWAKPYPTLGGWLDAEASGFALMGEENCTLVPTSALVVGDPQGAVRFDVTAGSGNGMAAALLSDGGVVALRTNLPVPSTIEAFDATGQSRWSRTIRSTGALGSFGIAADAAGRSVVVGGFRGTLEVDGQQYVTSLDEAGLENSTAGDAFAVLFDPGGGVVRAERFGGTDFDDARSVAFDAGGSVIIAGGTRSDHDLPGGPHTHQGLDGYYVRWCP